jgi:hypothetical protein
MDERPGAPVQFTDALLGGKTDGFIFVFVKKAMEPIGHRGMF